LKLQIKINGTTFEAEVEVLDDEVRSSDAPPTPHAATAQPVSAGAYIPARVAEVHGADEKQYRSPVTGLVIKVNAKQGQEVHPNEVIMVLEATKMENSITAHHAGRIKKVNFVPGTPVKLHQVLFELE
jgi:biotin carboxyl carrier protein